MGEDARAFGDGLMLDAQANGLIYHLDFAPIGAGAVFA